MELIHKIFAAFLQAAQPVDFQRKYSTYLHALAPFNVNRAMRAEAPSMMVRHVRFVAGASSDSNYPRSPPTTTFKELPFPLAALRHLELRTSIAAALQCNFPHFGGVKVIVVLLGRATCATSSYRSSERRRRLNSA